MRSSSSARDVMSVSEGGNSGGRICEGNGLRRGVEVVEFKLEGGRTRFARRNVKKAVHRRQPVLIETLKRSFLL